MHQDVETFVRVSAIYLAWHQNVAMSESHPVVPLVHSAFFKFVPVADPPALAQALRQLAIRLTGVVIVAHEGISGAVAGTPSDITAFEHTLTQAPCFAEDFVDMSFKRSGCTTKPFTRLKVSVKPEIVAFGMPGVSGAMLTDWSAVVPSAHLEGRLSPLQWRDLLSQDRVVVIDNRNSFEYRLGHFRGALNPRVNNFRDFAQHILDHRDQWVARGQRVAMYCTGGIRCEKTAPWMRSLGLDVYQLDGGILNHFQLLPDAERDWDGECFVFDKRIALDTHLCETTTTAQDVYDPKVPDEAWRLIRALRLEGLPSMANPRTSMQATVP